MWKVAQDGLKNRVATSESCSDLDVLVQTVCFAFRDDDAGASELKYVGEGRRP